MKKIDPQVEEFEDLDLEEQAPYEAYSRNIVRTRYPNFWFGAFLLSCLFLSLGMGTYWLLTRSGGSKLPSQVYVEMKVIDETGHPIAGADVYYKGKRLGVTDSFGEWRRFLKTRLGVTIPLQVRKQTEHDLVTVTKNIAVPLKLEKNGEVEIHTSVRLSRQAPAASTNFSSGGDRTEERETSSELSDDPGSPITAISSVWFKVIPAHQNPFAVSREAWLSQELIPALNELAEKEWRLDSSSTQIILQHIDLPTRASFPGLVRIVGRVPGGHPFDILSNYNEDPSRLARSLLRSIESSAEESSMFELDIFGLDPHAGVYVGGKKASHLAKHRWRYPGILNQHSYLTIVQKHSVVFRQLVQTTNDPFTVTVSRDKLARR